VTINTKKVKMAITSHTCLLTSNYSRLPESQMRIPPITICVGIIQDFLLPTDGKW
jgi:hypothetical protein